MTGHITRTWITHDGTTMAVIRTADRQDINASVPASASEGQSVKLVDGVWRLIARAA